MFYSIVSITGFSNIGGQNMAIISLPNGTMASIPSTHKYTNNTALLVSKKEDGKWININLLPLNKDTLPDNYLVGLLYRSPNVEFPYEIRCGFYDDSKVVHVSAKSPVNLLTKLENLIYGRPNRRILFHCDSKNRVSNLHAC